MNCGSDQAGGSLLSKAGPAADEGGAPQGQTVAQDQNEPDGYTCSCDSCYSVSPATISLALRAFPVPEAIPAAVAFFESVQREPLVPPPQLLS